MQTYNPEWELPVFSTVELGEKKTQYCTVIPVLNEGNRLHKQLETMQRLGIMGLTDVIIADGGSTDGSLRENTIRQFGIRAVLTKNDKGRLSAQLRMAYAWVLAEAYDGVVTIDGNNKDSAEHIKDMVQALDDGYDYVQASRFLPGGKAVNTPLTRYIAIRLVHAPLVSLAAHKWLTDTTQGYRAYSSRYLLSPVVKPFRNIFMNYELLAYLSARASRLGMNVKETPTFRIYPKGAVPTKISAVSGNLDLLITLYRLLVGGFNP